MKSLRTGIAAAFRALKRTKNAKRTCVLTKDFIVVRILTSRATKPLYFPQAQVLEFNIGKCYIRSGGNTGFL